MSVLSPVDLACACGTPVRVVLARSVNAPRAPALVEAARTGRLHRTACPACGTALRVERRLLWLDAPCGRLWLVLPPAARGEAPGALDALDRALGAPEVAGLFGGVAPGVLIGLAGLGAWLRARARAPGAPARAPGAAARRPQHRETAQLAALAAAVRRGTPLDVAAPAWHRMLAGLPRGAHLDAASRRHLAALFHHLGARGLEREEARLLEVRFAVTLDEDWVRNALRGDLPRLWAMLEALPDEHVEENAWLTSIELEPDAAGGWYDPQEREIGIGADELSDPTRFGAVLRHEVGHAVHEGRLGAVDRWLEARFGWRTHGLSDPEIDAWVHAMGGFGESSVEERRDVRRAVREAVGPGGRWALGPGPRLPAHHPWNRPDFGPRLALERTGSPWWEARAGWHRVGPRAFFANPWYATLIEVDAAALDLIERMPDGYAAMSHFEFFAELYAMHRDPANPRRRGLPRDVARWLSRELGPAEPGAPRRPHEEIRRPA